MNRRRAYVEQEDSSGLAGWMYADLLLALMVIFLATISFVPNFASLTSSAATQVKQIASGYNYNRGLSIIYKSFDPILLKADVSSFKTNEGLPEDSEIIYAQILGGFDPKKEGADAGKLRALEFARKISESDAQLLANASVNLSSNLLLNPDEIALRFTFVAKIK